jgi:AcrR family transcriptional regulator
MRSAWDLPILPDVEEDGLRVRKKRATREALSTAALRLAVEHGPANVRVADIAAAAGVAARTYNGYFTSREEAICALHADRATRIGAALRERPADEPLTEAITAAVLAEFIGSGEPDRVAFRLIATEPMVRGEFLKGVTSIEVPLAAAIAGRTGGDPNDLATRVLAAAVAAATRVATEHWLDADDTVFTEVLAVALRHATRTASGNTSPTSRAGDHTPRHSSRPVSAHGDDADLREN